MLTINKLIPGGRGLAAVLIKRAAHVALDWDVRQKSRFDTTDSLGRKLGVFLPRGTQVRGGDVLVADDGSLVQVTAAPQPVLVVRHGQQHGQPFDLLRAAYHLGNRHVALALHPDRLLLEPDHVLADMLRQQHLIVTEATEAFEPEGGAYGNAGHGHGHGHGHDHGDGHDHTHHHGGQHGHGDHQAHAADHGHAHAAAPAAAPGTSAGTRPVAVPVVAAAVPHVHGPGCGHDHGHDHAHDHPHGHDHAHAHDHSHGHADGKPHRH